MIEQFDQPETKNKYERCGKYDESKQIEQVEPLAKSKQIQEIQEIQRSLITWKLEQQLGKKQKHGIQEVEIIRINKTIRTHWTRERHASNRIVRNI